MVRYTFGVRCEKGRLSTSSPAESQKPQAQHNAKGKEREHTPSVPPTASSFPYNKQHSVCDDDPLRASPPAVLFLLFLFPFFFSFSQATTMRIYTF